MIFSLIYRKCPIIFPYNGFNAAFEIRTEDAPHLYSHLYIMETWKENSTPAY